MKKTLNGPFLIPIQIHLLLFCFFLCVQALRWCDEGAYLLASQMVDRFQTREGAQEALHCLSCHQERAPYALKNTQDILSLEFEAILTPQLQVLILTASHTKDSQLTSTRSVSSSSLVPDLHGNREAEFSAVHDQKPGAVSEEAGRYPGETGSAGGPQA